MQKILAFLFRRCLGDKRLNKIFNQKISLNEVALLKKKQKIAEHRI
jgi:hypothetical protein